MISIIIPALNEAGSLPGLLSYLNNALRGSPGHEILVCDGGSSDNTAQTALEHGARLIRCNIKGRAFQMHQGAEAATGDILYFLHADTYPPEDFCHTIERVVSQGAEAGCFRLNFHPGHPLLSLYCWFTRFNIRYLRFGDQSLFVKKEAYEAVGGFCLNHSVMEDNELAGRLMDQYRFVLLDAAVTTSSRKYMENGIIRLQILFAVTFAMYMAGVSQDVLTHFYKTHIR